MIARFLAGLLLALSLATAPAGAQFADQATWAGTSAGSANAHTITVPNALSLSDFLGVSVRFSPGNSNTTATTLQINALPATAMRKWSPAGLIALTGNELRAGAPVDVMYNGTFFVLLSPTMVQPVPTYQIFNTGTAQTYNTGVSGGQLARQLEIIMVGGGGGGGAATSNNGVTGTATIFNSIEAAGGIRGTCCGGANGGAGGTGGAGTADDRIPGGAGSSIPNTQNSFPGGVGGTSCFGGGGNVAINAAGGAAATNSGSGGGGGGNTNLNGGGGGGAGECVLLIINNPAASYPYSVGIGGAGGAAGNNAGAAGANGKIRVREIYLRPANDNWPIGEECRCAA